jgi:hypothetical protein
MKKIDFWSWRSVTSKELCEDVPKNVTCTDNVLLIIVLYNSKLKIAKNWIKDPSLFILIKNIKFLHSNYAYGYVGYPWIFIITKILKNGINFC